MDRFIYIRNAEDDAYVNTADNFRGMEQDASAAVTMYFESPVSSSYAGAYDKIVLGVTANKEKEAMIAIGGALAGAKAGSTCILADEYGSVFCDDNITSVTSISKATSATLRKTEAVAGGGGTGASDNAATRQLEVSDSGTTFLVDISAATAAFRLPAVAGSAGVNYKFVLASASDAEATNDLIVSSDANGENIIGVALDAGGVHDVVHTTSVLSLDTSDGAAGAGDRFGLICDGSHWYVEDATALTTGIFNVADNAI